jgi:hypothetical protein
MRRDRVPIADDPATSGCDATTGTIDEAGWGWASAPGGLDVD